MQLFAELSFCASVGIHLHNFKVLHEYFSLGKTSGPTMWAALSVRFHSRWCFVRSRDVVSARRIGLAMNRFLPSRPKFTKTFVFDFFLKTEETICCSEDKFRGHFNLRRRIQHVPKSIIWQMDMKVKHKAQEIRN